MTTIKLPQHDTSATRAAELAAARDAYAWDHDYLPPYPFLAIPNVEQTGALHVVDSLLGSFAGLPEQERPQTAFVVEKIEGSLSAFSELISRVPAAEWAKLAVAVRATLGAKAGVWLDELSAGLGELAGTQENAGVTRVKLPSSTDAVALLVRVLYEVVETVSPSGRRGGGSIPSRSAGPSANLVA